MHTPVSLKFKGLKTLDQKNSRNAKVIELCGYFSLWLRGVMSMSLSTFDSSGAYIIKVIY